MFVEGIVPRTARLDVPRMGHGSGFRYRGSMMTVAAPLQHLPAGVPDNPSTRRGNVAINFRKDADTVLAEAKAQHKPVLLDFSAAPM